jgi:hypothetical protein
LHRYAVDEFIGELLNKDYFCDIALPRIPHRQVRAVVAPGGVVRLVSWTVPAVIN